MKIRRTWASSEGPMASVSRLISEGFNVSEGEALRLLQADRVTLDGEVTNRRDLPVAELEGRRLAVGNEGVDLDG